MDKEPGRMQSMGLQRVGHAEKLTHSHDVIGIFRLKLKYSDTRYDIQKSIQHPNRGFQRSSPGQEFLA